MAGRQAEIFEAMHDEYAQSTSDEYAMAYREKHHFRRILRMLGDSRSIIEIASGTGETSGWLKKHKPGLQITGCDISRKAVADFQTLHDSPAFVADLTQPFTPSERYDAVLVMGGIHHMTNNLEATFANINRLLKPGGRLIMAEPSANFVMNPIRKLWYRLDSDHFDADDEEALDHNKLLREYGQGFRCREVRYLGGPAYFLLMLNMFLRFPSRFKKPIAPVIMKAEEFYEKLPGRLPFAAFIACWEKTSD